MQPSTIRMDKHVLLNKLENELKSTSPHLPHWQQLVLQGFWYGLLSWAITCAEDNVDPQINPPTLADMLKHADSEFEGWPVEWLQDEATKFLSLKLSVDELNSWFAKLDTVFLDCIPADLHIFGTFAEGETLTEEQWKRLYDTVAFIPPDITGFRKPQSRGKTRRVHGRRALTPMRRHNHHRAVTRHHSHVSVVKMGEKN